MSYTFHNRAGFTLLELMVAMLLGTIVMAAVFGVFESSNMAYLVQEEVAAIQQDVRISRTWIERDSRMAGAGLADYPPLTSLDAEDLQAFSFENGVGFGTSDRVTIRYVEPVPGCGGTDPNPGDGIDKPCDTLPPLNTFGDMPPTSNEVKLTETFDDDAADWAEAECWCGDDVYTTYNDTPLPVIIMTPPSYDEGEYGPPRAEILYITGTNDVNNQQQNPNQDRFRNNPNTTLPDGTTIDNKVANTFPPNSTVMFGSIKPINVFTYYINDENVLIREDWTEVEDPATDNPVVAQIAENIEDLQFSFGLDLLDENGAAGQDGVVDTWENGSGANMDGDDLSDAAKPFVKTIRISVLGRTDKEHKDLPPNNRPAIEDHAAADNGDYFHRRLSDVVVQLRNMAL